MARLSGQDGQLLAPEPKRKRGRPSAADASQRGAAEDEDEQARPRKRGRPRKSTDSNSTDAPPESAATTRKGKAEASATRGAKTTQTQRAKKGGRRSVADSDAGGSSRRRTRASDVQEAEESPEGQGPRQKRKRGRPSLRDLPASETHNRAALQAAKPRKKPRPSVSAAEPENSSRPAQKKAKGGRPSGGRSSMGSVAGSATASATAARSKSQHRPSQIASGNEDEPPPSPEKPFRHIAPRSRTVAQSTIQAKWSPLTGAAISASSTILTLANRPVLQRFPTVHKRRTHAASALRVVASRINRKIAGQGLPFPPASMPSSRRAAGASGENRADGGRETELDFESVLDAKSALERQLDPTVHAVELLRREKTRMEEELERDYETLRNLEAGARGQARQQRELLKKAHALTPDTMATPREDGDMIFDCDRLAATGSLFKDFEDPELKKLSLQLGDHVESIKGNLSQAEGIAAGIDKGRAGLRSVLMKHLGQDHYEHAILG